jgi:hypothetical protein
MHPRNDRPSDDVDPFAVIDRPIRRRLLAELADRQCAPGRDRRTVTVETLADGIARSAAAGTVVDARDVDAVRTELRHAHLPKLAAAGWVEYDPDAGVVAVPDGGEAVRSHLLAATAELDRLTAALKPPTPEPTTE